MADRVTITDLIARKRDGKRFSMVTAYDAIGAALVDEAEVEVILVGDSAANVVHGHETTLPVTLDEMLGHTRAAARGRKKALLVGDMPFLSYQPSIPDAIRSAGRFLKEGLADAVKLEGGAEVADTVRALVRCGIPVMGHVGLTPQSVHVFGGFKLQGRDEKRATEILEGARALEAAGAFAVVLECIPTPLAAEITKALSIPTIGIGAGPHCDAQVLVFHDLLGLSRRGGRRVPRFVKRYETLGDRAVAALKAFRADVIGGQFPDADHSYEKDTGRGGTPPAAAPPVEKPAKKPALSKVEGTSARTAAAPATEQASETSVELYPTSAQSSNAARGEG